MSMFLCRRGDTASIGFPSEREKERERERDRDRPRLPQPSKQMLHIRRDEDLLAQLAEQTDLSAQQDAAIKVLQSEAEQLRAMLALGALRLPLP